jgi:hypothetical protein
MTFDLRDITGFRGEKIIELILTDRSGFPGPLFRPAFLGDKWPAIDFYVELTTVGGQQPFFFVQAKSTTPALTARSKKLVVSTQRSDIEGLLRIPGPTYLLGVHEPTQRVFARSVHSGIPTKAITRIPLSYELTPANLKILHDEVRDFWSTRNLKPTDSVFA